MEYRDYAAWWVVRDIVWCQVCGQREVNGADLCAHCQALDAELEEACRS